MDIEVTERDNGKVFQKENKWGKPPSVLSSFLFNMQHAGCLETQQPS